MTMSLVNRPHLEHPRGRLTQQEFDLTGMEIFGNRVGRDSFPNQMDCQEQHSLMYLKILKFPILKSQLMFINDKNMEIFTYGNIVWFYKFS